MSKPVAGDHFAFELKDGRFGLCRVVNADGDDVLVAATAWIGEAVPVLSEIGFVDLLVRTSFSHDEALCAINVGEPEPPEGFVFVGNLRGEESVVVPSNSWGMWTGFPIWVLDEWRWHNDKEGLLADREAEKVDRERAAAVAMVERQRWLDSLTLSSLESHVFFESWESFVDEELIAASRGALKHTISALIGEEDPDARYELLLACMGAFDELDEEHEFIMTIEREDICEAVSLIAEVAGVDEEQIDELMEHRDW